MRAQFTGDGWRQPNEPGCFELAPSGWRCERKRGHRGWHSCDNASWPPGDPLGGMKKPLGS